MRVEKRRWMHGISGTMTLPDDVVAEYNAKKSIYRAIDNYRRQTDLPIETWRLRETQAIAFANKAAGFGRYDIMIRGTLAVVCRGNRFKVFWATEYIGRAIRMVETILRGEELTLSLYSEPMMSGDCQSAEIDELHELTSNGDLLRFAMHRNWMFSLCS